MSCESPCSWPFCTSGSSGGGSSPGAPPTRRRVPACRATSCSRTPTAWRPARSRSTPRRPRCGRGWRRWARRRAAAPTPTTGSRTCSGSNMHSTDRVLPEFQHPAVGDTIGLGPNPMRLERVEPERVLAWRSADGNWVWTFVIEPRGAGGSRLISRNRFRLPTPRRPPRHAADGARLAGDGAEDAARDQAPGRGLPAAGAARPAGGPVVPRLPAQVVLRRGVDAVVVRRHLAHRRATRCACSTATRGDGTTVNRMERAPRPLLLVSVA